MRALLTDLDGVVRRFDVDPAAIERDCGLALGSLHRVAFAPDRLLPAITGAVTDETWRERIVDALAVEQPGSDAASAVSRWSGPPGVVVSEVWDVLCRARAHARLVLVTNATSRLDSDLAALGLSFDAVVNSSDHGWAKPDARIFAVALEAAGVPASDAVFVDDSPGNVAAAEALGIRSHRFTDAEALRSFLFRA